jgi:hypothetical protein
MELPNDEVPILAHIYSTYDPDKNDRGLGLGDFFTFNLMLLSIQPHSSSITTKIEHIIAVQLGLETMYRLGHIYELWLPSALPLPVITVSSIIKL